MTPTVGALAHPPDPPLPPVVGPGADDPPATGCRLQLTGVVIHSALGREAAEGSSWASGVALGAAVAVGCIWEYWAKDLGGALGFGGFLDLDPPPFFGFEVLATGVWGCSSSSSSSSPPPRSSSSSSSLPPPRDGVPSGAFRFLSPSRRLTRTPHRERC